MTSATEILVDAFGRVHDTMHATLPGLDSAALLWQPDPAANSIGWLAWHLTRVQDDHLAGVGQTPQAWTGQGFVDQFALPYSPATVGYGQTAEEVRRFSVGDPGLLLAYHDAVHEQTLAILAGLDDAGFARIVDTRWDPPVTAAVRLVSVVNDTMAHLGQMGYVHGLYQRR